MRTTTATGDNVKHLRPRHIPLNSSSSSAADITGFGIAPVRALDAIATEVLVGELQGRIQRQSIIAEPAYTQYGHAG